MYGPMELELFSGLSWGFKLSTDTCKAWGERLWCHMYLEAEASVRTFCKKKSNYNCTANSAWIPDKRGAWIAATQRFSTFPSSLVFTSTGFPSGLDSGAGEWFEFMWSCYAAMSIFGVGFFGGVFWLFCFVFLVVCFFFFLRLLVSLQQAFCLVFSTVPPVLVKWGQDKNGNRVRWSFAESLFYFFLQLWLCNDSFSTV